MRIRFTFAHIETFIAVAESGSFRGAAERLHISQPAVTSRIQQLEQRVGLALLARTTRSVQLTLDGQRFLDHARDVLGGLEDLAGALRERADFNRGVVSLAALPSITAGLLPEIMRAFRSRYPYIALRIVEAAGGRAVDLLANGDVDLAITSPQPRRGMEFVPLWTDPCVAIAPGDHPLAKKRGVTLAEIAQFPLLLYPHGTTLRDTIDKAFEQQGMVPSPVFEAFQVLTLVSLAEAGFGIAFAPHAILRRINLGACTMLDLRAEALDRSIGLLRLKKPASPAVSAFLAFCRSVDAGSSRPKQDGVAGPDLSTEPINR